WGGQPVGGAPAEQRGGGDPREPTPEERIEGVRVPAHARQGGALAVLERQRLDRLVGWRQCQRRHRVVEDGRHHLGHVHPEEEGVDPAVHLDADRVDEDERREPARRHRRQLGADPAAERGAHEVHAGEPPWPGWLGKYTVKLLARRSWNGSQRPAPPAPWRKNSAGPAPAVKRWIGVPRTGSSRRSIVISR